MPLRPKFREALGLIATAIERLQARGFEAPILVGGAAVELLTGSAVTSADFDFVSPWKDEFFEELQKVGFERPTKPGWLRNSLYHPRLNFGLQVVSGVLMDGHTDRTRIKVFEVGGKVRVTPVEDLIADRMAQALAGRTIREDMKNQAVRVYQLAGKVDEDYLDGRIRSETANEASLATLKAWSDDGR
jgi:hypothetical protein